MSPGKPLRGKYGTWIPFSAALFITGAMLALYTANIVTWADSPDFGWRTMYSSGPNQVAELFPSGETAGLRSGDTIRAINGKPYSTFDELFFKVRSRAPGTVTVYTVQRGDRTLEISMVTAPLGITASLRRSGPIFVIGVLYVLIGVIVYLMNPQGAESLLFFNMSCLLGLEIGMGAPSDLLNPLWLFDVRKLAEIFLPAAMIHLALKFPKERTALKKMPRIWILPYAGSLAIFVLFRLATRAVWEAAPVLDRIHSMYFLFGVAFFITSVIWNMAKDASRVIRLQSRMIFLGIAIGLFVPLSDTLVRYYFKIYMFPNPAVGFAFFLLAFPLSIGYTIVKHDLFAIDVIIRRTYGYILSTGSVVAVYGVIVAILNYAFQSSEIAQSPAFSILFALAVVFFFRPLHERFQQVVDRVFYRQRYDYRKTIHSISDAMTSILDPRQIQKMLIGSVVSEMALENGLIMLRDEDRRSYKVHIVEGEGAEKFQEKELMETDVLVETLKGKSTPFFRYDLEMDPAYKQHSEVLQERFQAFGAESMIPLKYKDVMRGIVSLGRKKSGKLFTAEDIDLLKTITNQSAIALENAKLFEENLEKGRMEEELRIAQEIQVSMLPERAPAVEGFSVAARSIPAREVGGDFYDFIEMNGGGGGTRLGIVIGDVSGKAVSGALVMAASRSIFRVLTEAKDSVAEVMNTGNSRLHKDVKKGMFVALAYAVLDSNEKKLILSNAGQPQPIHCPADCSGPRYIETEGDRFPLGIVLDCTYQETHMMLRDGDTLLFYTDGVVEAVDRNGELYGFDRLMASTEASRQMGAEDLLDFLLRDISGFVGGMEQHDDITMVVVKVEHTRKGGGDHGE